MSVKSYTPPTPILPPTLRAHSSFESFHSLSSDSLETLAVDDLVTEEGLRHARQKLVAKLYKDRSFAVDLAQILSALRLPSWQAIRIINPEDITIRKVSGSLTNAVFFISHPAARTVLLRIYGSSSGSLISRPRELHTLHILSSQYHFGPKVYGTFANGRIEEYFDSIPLTPSELRDPLVSTFIATRMAELHHVKITAVEEEGWDLGIRKNVRGWIGPAKEVLQLANQETKDTFDLHEFVVLWEKYWNWLRHWEKDYGESPRVFAHNDAQYGNLLRLTNPSPLRPPHQQIIVVDFEYAAPNAAAFDIANHFHEWTANYHSDTPWLLDHAVYPSHQERRLFYNAYLKGVKGSHQEITEEDLKLLELQVRAWSPASHAMWAIWGIVQAREELETHEPAEFDYLRYARCRWEGFRRELAPLKL